MQDWIAERYGDQDGFDFYAANVAENADHVAAYVEQIGLEVPVLMVSSQIAQQYQLRGRASPYPLDFIIDGEGVVQYGQHEYEPELMLETLDRLLEIEDNGVGEVETEYPDGFVLYPAFPNPFNSVTNISYYLPSATDVSLQLYNLKGQRVLMLFEGQQKAGYQTATLHADGLSSGLYFVRLEAGGRYQTNKILLCK